MKKILHVIAELDPERGGVAQALRTIINGLSAEGIDSEVVSLDSPTASFLEKDTFPVYALGPRAGQWGYTPKLFTWLLDNFFKYDVVIVHGLWLYPGYAVRKAIQSLKNKKSEKACPKFFVMPHGMLDPWFQQAATRRVKALRNWVYWKLIESKVVEAADGLLFTCEAELRLAREPFRPYKPQREAVVGLGVDEPPVHTAAMQSAFFNQYPALKSTPYFLFLSRIHEKKGIDLLIKSYHNLVQKYLIESDILVAAGSEPDRITNKLNLPKLVIAGPGLETPYGQEMQQLASSYQHLEDLVIFSGMLTGNAKWGAFYGCEAFVLPSHQENFGIAVVEALACGKPVLISNQVNIWREIKAVGGGLIADDSVEGTQQNLEDWINLSDGEKQTIGLCAKQSYRKYFAVTPAAAHLLATIT